MPDPTAAIRYSLDHQDEALEDLKAFLRIASISTLPEHEKDIILAASWVAEKLKAMGFEQVAVIPTARHPVVYGEWLKAGKAAPTLLFYGHYDVQPVDPIDEWETEPFVPTVRGENLYARGASDMKGQVIAHLKAIEAFQKTSGLPVNIKCMIEGEEEIGSPSLEAFINANKERLKSDLCLNGDSGIIAPDRPSLVVALRGLTYHEIRLTGQRTDQHSGSFGGVIDNPAMVMAKLLAGMKDDQGRILLPGFYDDVRELSQHDREMLPELSDDWWKETAGAKVLFGEPGYSTTERAKARPTLDVNGILSGFTGEGSKTVLPARAMAKVSMRLVPDQTPARVRAQLVQYLESHVPETVTWQSAAVQAGVRAFEKVWGTTPVFDRVGGTVPVVDLLQKQLGVNTLMLGFGLPNDNIHGPNEKQHLPTYFKGIETAIHFFNEFAS